MVLQVAGSSPQPKHKGISAPHTICNPSWAYRQIPIAKDKGISAPSFYLHTSLQPYRQLEAQHSYGHRKHCTTNHLHTVSQNYMQLEAPHSWGQMDSHITHLLHIPSQAYRHLPPLYSTTSIPHHCPTGRQKPATKATFPPPSISAALYLCTSP